MERSYGVPFGRLGALLPQFIVQMVISSQPEPLPEHLGEICELVKTEQGMRGDNRPRCRSSCFG